MGTPPLRRMSRSALVHLKGEKEFSLGGYLAPPVMFTKRKGIPVEGRDFSRGKRYSAARIVERNTGLSGVVSDKTNREVCDLWMNVWSRDLTSDFSLYFEVL